MVSYKKNYEYWLENQQQYSIYYRLTLSNPHHVSTRKYIKLLQSYREKPIVGGGAIGRSIVMGAVGSIPITGGAWVEVV